MHMQARGSAEGCKAGGGGQGTVESALNKSHNRTTVSRQEAEGGMRLCVCVLA